MSYRLDDESEQAMNEGRGLCRCLAVGATQGQKQKGEGIMISKLENMDYDAARNPKEQGVLK